MAKELKLWNGRGYCCKKLDDPSWDSLGREGPPHAYVAAYSRADARRVIAEYCGKMPSDFELSVYWNEGTWGNYMNDVVPERGLWLAFIPRSPTRVI